MVFNPITDSLTFEINKKLSEFSPATITSHIKSYGFLTLDKAHTEIEANGKVFKVSIPFIKNEKVEAIMFAYPLHDGSEEIILELIPAEIFEMTDQDLLNILTVETTLLAMSTFSRHQLWVNAKYLGNFQERLIAFFNSHPLPREICFVTTCFEYEISSPGSGYPSSGPLFDCVTEHWNCSGGSVGGPPNTTTDNWNNTSNENGGGGDENTNTGNKPVTDPGTNYDPDALCKEQINAYLLNYIQNVVHVQFPCNSGSGMDDDQIIQIMNDLCGSQPMIDFTDFENELNEYDHIDVSVLEEECPCLKKLLDAFKNSSPSNNYFCQIINEMDGSDQFKLDFVLGNSFTTIPNNNYPQSITSPNDLTIVIPTSVCSSSDSQNLEENQTKFLHELVHAKFCQLLSENDQNVDLSTLYVLLDNKVRYNSDVWNILVSNYHDMEQLSSLDGDHHYLFFLYLRDFFAEAFRNFNGNLGALEDYYYLAHLTINTQNLAMAIRGEVDNNDDGIPDYPFWLNGTNGSNGLSQENRDFLEGFSIEALESDWEDSSFSINFPINCD